MKLFLKLLGWAVILGVVYSVGRDVYTAFKGGEYLSTTVGDVLVLSVHFAIAAGGVYLIHLSNEIEEPEDEYQAALNHHRYHSNEEEFNQVGILRKG